MLGEDVSADIVNHFIAQHIVLLELLMWSLSTNESSGGSAATFDAIVAAIGAGVALSSSWSLSENNMIVQMMFCLVTMSR